MSYLKLTLSAPLQFYFDNKVMRPSNNYDRNTKLHPTKEVVIGMIGCALGIKREDKESLSKIQNQLKNCFYRTIKNGIIYTDFQVAHGAFDKFETVSGKVVDGNIIRNIQYINDFEFELYLEADENILNQWYEAFRNPFWPVYLGKKKCIPEKPIVGKEKIILTEEEFKEIENVYNCA